MRPGYAFFFGEEEDLEVDPQTVVADKNDIKGTVFLQIKEIDGTSHAVFKDRHGQFWAQTEVFSQVG